MYIYIYIHILAASRYETETPRSNTQLETQDSKRIDIHLAAMSIALPNVQGQYYFKTY